MLSRDEITAIGKACGDELDVRIDAKISLYMKTKFELVMGLDCTDEEQRAETRKDHEFLRRVRLGSEHAESKFYLALIGAAFAGVLYLAGLGEKLHFLK